MPSLPSLPDLGVTRGLLVVVRMLPLLVIVCLSAPAWLVWVFLPTDRQQIVLDMVQALAAWARDVTKAEDAPDMAKPQLPDAGEAEGVGAKPPDAVRPSPERPPVGEGRRPSRP